MFIRDTIRFIELQLSFFILRTFISAGGKSDKFEFQLYIVHFTCLCNHVHQRYNSVRAPAVCCLFYVPGNSSKTASSGTTGPVVPEGVAAPVDAGVSAAPAGPMGPEMF